MVEGLGGCGVYAFMVVRCEMAYSDPEWNTPNKMVVRVLGDRANDHVM